MEKFLDRLGEIFATIIILVMIVVGILWVTGCIDTSTEELIQKAIPYCYGVAAIIVTFKIIAVAFALRYEIKIAKLKNHLKDILAKRHSEDVPLKLEEVMDQELVPFIKAVKQMDEDDTNATMRVLQKRLHEVVENLAEQRVAEIKNNMAKDNDERIREINILSAGLSDVIERRNYLLDLEKEIKQKQEEDRKHRLDITQEYTMLVFSLAGTSVEDVEKVCDVVKLFIETGQVAANKDLHIPLNKILRNAELKQFVTNIIRYNEKDNLDGDSFLQTAFCEWFSGKKENIAKNYSVLPKDSLVSKDGVESDLERLRKDVNSKI